MELFRKCLLSNKLYLLESQSKLHKILSGGLHNIVYGKTLVFHKNVSFVAKKIRAKYAKEMEIAYDLGKNDIYN